MVERIPDKNEVHGSIPCAPTQILVPMEVVSASPAELMSQKSTDVVVGTIKRLIRSEVITEFTTLNQAIGTEATQFRDIFDKSIANRDESKWAQEQDRLDAWTVSDEGRSTMSHLVGACVDLVSDDSYNGPPAHDKSHYLKDLHSGLVATREDKYRPWQKEAAAIGSLMHDFGKMLEVPLTGKHATGVVATDHANISYFLVNRLIKSYGNMPQGLEDQILYAIVTHQQGTSKETVAQLVQRADREHLVGAEGVRRMFIADAGLEGRKLHTDIRSDRRIELSLPAKPEDDSLFHHIEFYMRNLYPQIGSCGSIRAEDLKAEAGIFLWMASPEAVRKQIFSPEFERDELLTSGRQYVQGENKFKKVLDTQTWGKIKTGPTENDQREMEKYKSTPLPELLKLFIARKNTNLTWKTEQAAAPEDVLANLNKQVVALSKEESTKLHDGLRFALVRIERQEREMINDAQGIVNTSPKGSTESQIANLILTRYK